MLTTHPGAWSGDRLLADLEASEILMLIRLMNGSIASFERKTSLGLLDNLPRVTETLAEVRSLETWLSCELARRLMKADPGKEFLMYTGQRTDPYWSAAPVA